MMTWLLKTLLLFRSPFPTHQKTTIQMSNIISHILVSQKTRKKMYYGEYRLHCLYSVTSVVKQENRKGYKEFQLEWNVCLWCNTLVTRTHSEGLHHLVCVSAHVASAKSVPRACATRIVLLCLKYVKTYSAEAYKSVRLTCRLAMRGLACKNPKIIFTFVSLGMRSPCPGLSRA